MSIGIGLGIAGFPFSSPQAFLSWIDLCEQRGVDSVWLSERIGPTERHSDGGVAPLPFKRALL
jgi:hypothetical protein